MENDVISKIASGVYKTTTKRGRSKIWEIYAEILDQDGKYIKDVVYCRSCNRILKYNGKQTSNLVRHKCYSLIDFPLKQLQPIEKRIMLDACSQWMTENNGPVPSVANNGFRKLIKTVVRIGAKYGENLDIEDLIPDLTSVSREINKETIDPIDDIDIKSEIVNEVLQDDDIDDITSDVDNSEFEEPTTSVARAPSPSASEESDLLMVQKSSHPPSIEVEIHSTPKPSKVQQPASKKAKLSHEIQYTENYLDKLRTQKLNLQKKPPQPHKVQSSHLEQNESVHICSSCPCIAAQETTFDKVAKAWASELNEMTHEQQIFAKRFIAEIIFEGQLGGLHRGAVTVHSSHQRNTDDPLHE